MRFALINPAWGFDGSIYFGCREPHLPLELGYSKALLERAGHTVTIFLNKPVGRHPPAHGVVRSESAEEFGKLNLR